MAQEGYVGEPGHTWADIAESTGLSPAALRKIRSTFRPYLGLDSRGYPGENTQRVVKAIIELKQSGMDEEAIVEALKNAFSEGAGWPQEVLARMQASATASATLSAREVLETVSTGDGLYEYGSRETTGDGANLSLFEWPVAPRVSPETEKSIRESIFDFRREMRLYFIRAREQQDSIQAQLSSLMAEIRELRYQLGLYASRKERKQRGRA
ncbi:MAG TPA: hypothetical protein GX510_00140 [Firmicutes bacterium]|nr:hypothetical protein [Candidatus Fermentithermobacillaceae bacterium]